MKRLPPSLLAMCQGARVSSDRFARNFASSKESLRIRRREVGAMACLSAATLATQIHPGCLPPTALFVTVSRILPSQIQLCTTLYIVNPYRRFRPVLKISAPHCFGPKPNLTNLPEAQRGRGYKNFPIKDRMPMVRWLTDPGSVGNREPKTSWCSFMTVAGNSGKFTHEMLTKSRF